MEKVKIEPFKVIGISVRTTNQNGQAAEEIAALWTRFMGEEVMKAIPHRVSDTIYSLYTDYESDHTAPYTAILACEVSSLEDVPAGMVGKAFEGGSYVKLSARGDLTQGLIVKEWKKIWEMDLERSFTVDFELFGPKAQDPQDATIDFLVAVK